MRQKASNWRKILLEWCTYNYNSGPTLLVWVRVKLDRVARNTTTVPYTYAVVKSLIYLFASLYWCHLLFHHLLFRLLRRWHVKMKRIRKLNLFLGNPLFWVLLYWRIGDTTAESCFCVGAKKNTFALSINRLSVIISHPSSPQCGQ